MSVAVPYWFCLSSRTSVIDPGIGETGIAGILILKKPIDSKGRAAHESAESRDFRLRHRLRAVGHAVVGEIKTGPVSGFHQLLQRSQLRSGHCDAIIPRN